MIIKNFNELATTTLRKRALLIAESGLEAINTSAAVRRSVQFNNSRGLLEIQGRTYDMHAYDRVLVVGFGKAAYEAVSALYEVLGSRIQCGFVLDLKGGSKGTLTCTIGSHPYPTTVNVEATRQIVEVLHTLTEKDLLICVVSGGGSSLLCYPYNMSCEEQTRIVEALMHAGATIQELNTVRKHISKVKGGQLAAAAYPAQIINLVFSDVPGDDMSMVASGPTLLDGTTVHDAAAVLRKYRVMEVCSLPDCELQETPKEEKYFTRVTSHMLVSGSLALEAMQVKAQDLGLRATIYKSGYSGEARTLAAEFVEATQQGECLLASGESTVTVTVGGKGGRNLEMALSALTHLKKNQVFMALDTDGHDNTDFAGAIVDDQTIKKAHGLSLDPVAALQSNSSYVFFEAVEDYVYTGLTGSNVADFIISIKD
jgi:glycerate-2-kinase